MATVKGDNQLAPHGTISPVKKGAPVKLPSGGRTIEAAEDLPGFVGGKKLAGLGKAFTDAGIVK